MIHTPTLHRLRVAPFTSQLQWSLCLNAEYLQSEKAHIPSQSQKASTQTTNRILGMLNEPTRFTVACLPFEGSMEPFRDGI